MIAESRFDNTGGSNQQGDNQQGADVAAHCCWAYKFWSPFLISGGSGSGRRGSG
eukprot:CAMPEP_0178588488 /NCGR_PEP_ID=MMETSP0697-20121206/27062_1 /TAXON_ID=265572 /ORGANISM="Extubocellulus spinifer, Strain CCMP396" /LENGTH=53 /DNA_ID=CAMNT_0020224845 /DNA_START=213 /DNA_END=370 /DNA_ORIENTATION=-